MERRKELEEEWVRRGGTDTFRRLLMERELSDKTLRELAIVSSQTVHVSTSSVTQYQQSHPETLLFRKQCPYAAESKHQVRLCSVRESVRDKQSSGDVMTKLWGLDSLTAGRGRMEGEDERENGGRR